MLGGFRKDNEVGSSRQKTVLSISLILLAVLSWNTAAREEQATFIINFPSISPNGDGVKDYLSVSMILTEQADTLALTVEDQSATQVYDTLFFLAPAPGGEYTAVWYGTDSLDTQLGEGEYLMRLYESTGSAPEEQTRTVIIDTTPPTITIDRIEPGVFSPGYPDTSANVTIYYIVNGYETGSDAYISITDPEAVTDLFSLDVTSDGEYSYIIKPAAGWPEGIYMIELTIIDEAANSTTDQGALDVDSSGPVIMFVTSIPADTREVPLHITGYCHDRSGVEDTLYLSWGHKDQDGNYEESDYFQPDFTWLQADSLYWTFNTPDSINGIESYIEGTYSLKVTSSDSYGQQEQKTLEVNLDRTAPAVPVISNSNGRVIESPLELILVYDNDDSDSLLIYRYFEDVFTVKRIARYMPHTVDLGLGINQIWVAAKDKAGNLSENSNIVTINYDLSVSIVYPEVFRTPDLFQIITEDIMQRVIIDIYDLGGEHVRKLFAWGPSTQFEIEWDLRNGDGDTVRNGPYIMVMTIDYGTRKTIEKSFIAVVR